MSLSPSSSPTRHLHPARAALVHAPPAHPGRRAPRRGAHGTHRPHRPVHVGQAGRRVNGRSTARTGLSIPCGAPARAPRHPDRAVPGLPARAHGSGGAGGGSSGLCSPPTRRRARRPGHDARRERSASRHRRQVQRANPPPSRRAGGTGIMSGEGAGGNTAPHRRRMRVRRYVDSRVRARRDPGARAGGATRRGPQRPPAHHAWTSPPSTWRSGTWTRSRRSARHRPTRAVAGLRAQRRGAARPRPRRCAPGGPRPGLPSRRSTTLGSCR